MQWRIPFGLIDGRSIMYAITGITGKVGGALARALLEDKQPVRAVVRDVNKAESWEAVGCEIALAEMDDAAALTRAFEGAQGVFILPPSDFDPEPHFPKAKAVIAAVSEAIVTAQPQRVVCLSTIGAQAVNTNLLTQRTLMEQALSKLDVPVTFLRPGWFMENALWDVASARDEGAIHSFLQPLDKTVPMIATADVGRTAAALIQQSWQGRRIVELEGQHVSPEDIAATFSVILGRSVQARAVPRETWDNLFRSQGMQHPLARIRMLDGFNEGWISFEGGNIERIQGTISLVAVLTQLANLDY